MVRHFSKRRSIRTIWLFCEGEKTEKNYFEKLRSEERIRQICIKVKSPTRKHPAGMVQEAIEFKKSSANFFAEDEIFCIFDRDMNTDQQIASAVKLAKDNDIKLIFSNPCFEYWILCHFEKNNSACEIDTIISKLKRYLGEYEKNDREIYLKTHARRNEAIKNAKEAVGYHKKLGIEFFSRKSNPSTNVHALIEYLISIKSE